MRDLERRRLVLRAGVAAATLLAVVAAATTTLAGREPDGRAQQPDDPSRWRTWVLASPSEVRVPPPGRAAVRAAAAGPSGTARPRAPEDPLSPWIRRALGSVAHHTKNPPAASRAYALVSIAACDAAVAAAHWQTVHGGGHPSVRTAIAGAASRALKAVFPEEPGARLDADARAAADAEVAAGRAAPAAASAGLELGRRVAARVVRRVRGDRVDPLWDGPRPRDRGSWAPPPGSVARPVAPLAARWHTWLLPSPSAVRPPAPPRYGSPEYLAAAAEVVRVGRSLTPEQTRIARFWAGGENTGLPPGIWNQVALEVVRDRRLSPFRSARTFALLNAALADAGVATWDAKYAYWSARPVNAVADLGLAQGWQPLLPTPTFPSYPSGHSAYSAAAATVLAHLFPDQADLFAAKAEEAAQSRLYGGIHFRFDNDAGLRMGRAIGRRAVARARADGTAG
ncbi:MAG TPA: vanadium-dependent haloperoxidase [Solirubrobacteraceae bacterium]|nr:vanadium-dependent haloperoxidase [Solirubrobacteraceae bacterium]